MRLTALGAVLVSVSVGLSADEGLVPGTDYDPDIPTLKEVIGHDFGAEITAPHQIEDYLEALAAAAPDRARWIPYGTSWEGRTLGILVVGSPERISRLDDVGANLRRLAKAAEGAEALVDELPVVLAFLHAVHGAEISPSDAALAQAYHLLAARNDPAADVIRNQALVLIDPIQNPDGRARILQSNRETRADPPDPAPVSAEHDEPWPGGRSNHYLFDMNRDWFAQTQRETRAKVSMILEWMPHVVVDLHEMAGSDVTYFFPPPAPTNNPYVSAGQHEVWELLGAAMAARFEERGFPYFTRELYGASPNPGSGSSWPLNHGMVGMLFESATPLSLLHRRQDKTLLAYRDPMIHHFTAAIATAETAARNREKILRHFLEYRRAAIDEGEKEAFLIPAEPDPGQAARFARALERNGVDVVHAAGGYVVSLAQPSGRVARNLLDPTARWSLPLLYDIDVIPIDASTPAAGANRREALPRTELAYLLPWNASTAATVVEALAGGMRARFADNTAVFRIPDHDPDLRERLGSLADKHDAVVRVEGISPGSNKVRPLKPPRVLMAWGYPVENYSAGWARFVLEQRYRQSVTIVRVRSFARVDFSDYDVIVLPSGKYSPAFDPDLIRRLHEWTLMGGTLVTIAEASRWASRASVRLLETHTENREGEPEEESAHTDPALDRPFPVPFEYSEGEPAEPRRPPSTSGLTRAVVEPTHWLASGTDGELAVMVNGRRIFAPIALENGFNVASFVEGPLAGKAALMHQPTGRGHVIAFAEDPNAYGFMEATELLFMNAVLLGPAHLPLP